MPAQLVSLLAFNRGRVSPRGLARVDLDRVPLSADVMTNWIPRVLGSMMLRPGWAYLGATFNNVAARFLPFIFSTTDTALLELTDTNMRVWIGDALLTRVAVTGTVSNGTFSGSLTGWTSNDEAGGSSVWVAGNQMGLTGNGTAAAIRDENVTIDQPGVEHALRIVINRGPVVVSIGSTSGGGEYYNSITLETGTHSIAFTPAGNIWVRFLSRLKRQVLVGSCTIETAGVVSLPTPWNAATIGLVRTDQSADVLFCAADGFQQRRIVRRSTRSWGIERFAPEDGPFNLENTSTTTIAASWLSGNITLTASRPIFSSRHVGALFSLSSQGQDVKQDIAAQNTFGGAIQVSNVGTARAFTIILTGVWVATVSLQQSTTGTTGPWVTKKTWAANTSESYNDTLDNLTVWYRLGVETGNYTSGTVSTELIYAIGSIRGICRVTGFTDTTHVSAEVIVDFGGTAAAATWEEGTWSDFRGWPSSVSFHDGRLFFAGKGSVWGSISDAFSSFDETVIGDAGLVSGSLGSGPVDRINWILSLQRLMLGTQGAELSCLSNNFDDPLTPTTFHIKRASTQGSGTVQAVQVDDSGVYVQRGGTRVFELSFSSEKLNYVSVDLTTFIPEIGRPGILRMAVQRQPDTRVHCIRSDGTVALLVFDKNENTLCWCDVTTSGLVEDVVVLPGADYTEEDAVYYVVNRTINGATVRYLERWALETDCMGGTLNKQADSFVVVNAGDSVIGGLSHLIGQSVVCWGDGNDLGGTFVVNGSGQITVPKRVTQAIVGLQYTAQWKSGKLSHRQFHLSAFTGRGTALTQQKSLEHLGVVMYKTHVQGLQYGPSFDHLDNLPLVEEGRVVTATMWDAYDKESFEFSGTWDSDARVCLQAKAPRPCSLMALIVPLQIEDQP